MNQIAQDLETIYLKELNDRSHSKTGKTWLIEENKKILNYPNAERLIQFYQSFDDISKQKVKKELCNTLITSPEFWDSNIGNSSHSQLIFFALLKIGQIDELFRALESRNALKNPSNSILELLNDDLDEITSYLNRHQINELFDIIQEFTTHSPNRRKQLLEKLLSIRVTLLDLVINKINIEINIDKANLIKKIKDWGFDENFNGLLTKIDEYLVKDDPLINSGMINNLRTFMGDLVIQLAEKIALAEKEDIPKDPNKQKVGNCRSYLKSKLKLSEEENSFLNNFINILHSEGGHSFISEKEYLRLARNIAIEISLFLITKSNKYSNTNLKSKISKLFS